MIDIASLAEGVQPGEAGIWLAPQRRAISHPQECQDWYLTVEDKSYWFRHRANCIIQCLRRFPPGGPVLDVGGGNGHVSLAMQQAGYQPILLEPSLPSAQNARARGITNIICATLEDAAFNSGSVAAVGIFDVLEHIADDARFLQLLHDALVPDGRLYLTVPAFGWLWSGYDHHVGHYRRYSLRQLQRLLEAQGFQLEMASYLYGVLPLPIFLMRSLPSRLGRGRHDLDQFQREHAAQPGAAARLIEKTLAWEHRRLVACKTIPFGSSCLVVARKRSG